MFEPQITLSGNLAFDPKLRTSAGGYPVLDLRVATSPRIQKDGEWVDGETLWFDVVCWRRLAENVAQTLHKGDTVTVTGKLYNSSYDKVDTETGEVTRVDKLAIEAQHVGVDLTRHLAEVKRVQRSNPEDALGDRFADVPRQAEELAA